VVLEVLEHINQTLGHHHGLITHNAGIAAMADRVIHLADGRIVRVERPRSASGAEIQW